MPVSTYESVSMMLTDRVREHAIDLACTQMICATRRPARIAAFEHLRELINARSAEQVAKMEHDRGLA